MLFDTLRRKNQAEQEEREWNANRPADYVSRNKDAMDSLTGQIAAGSTGTPAAKLPAVPRPGPGQCCRQRGERPGQRGDAGGWVWQQLRDSVAKQGQQQALSGIDNAVPGLRARH